MRTILGSDCCVGEPVAGGPYGENELGEELAEFARPLRILFALHTPWTVRLGVPRVSIEIGKQLERLGHQCSHYAWEDAFPQGLNKGSRFFEVALFQRQFLSFMQKHARDFDVVQVEMGLAPFSRKAYAFNGIMVAKSNGLPLFYDRYLRSVEPHLKRKLGERGTWAGNALRALGRFAAGGSWGSALRTCLAADLVHVLNHDEQVALEAYGLNRKLTLVPNGLSEDFHLALRSGSTALNRAGSRVITFIGMWQARKGRLEFPAIVRKVREACPEAVFRLVGTCVGEEKVLPAFDARDRSWIWVQPSYDPQELPALLADAKAGVFPSYIEGFPLGVLELMAAGLPVVAWDVPGTRDFAGKPDSYLLVTAGDVEATSSALTRLLRLPAEDYIKLSTATLAAAGAYTWQRSAGSFLRSLQPLLANAARRSRQERVI